MQRYYIIFILFIMNIFSLPSNAQVFELSSAKHSSLLINKDIPAVYKPSKLIIGNKTKFIIKAEPQSHVSLVTSEENGGGPLFHGKKLRLGQIIKPYEGIVGNNGVLELEVAIPNEKGLIGKVLYFEVVIWKKSDFSDLKIAKIMGVDAKETDINAVVITAPPKNTTLPGIGPGIPGTGGDLNKTMEIFHKINETSIDKNSEDSYEEMYYNNEPLMLRNLRAPEVKNQNKDK